MSIQTLLTAAITKRQIFLQQCDVEKTDCYRLFHGTAEGDVFNGLNIDRYGDAWLIQSFQQTLDEETLQTISAVLTEVFDFPIIYNDRSNKNSRVLNELNQDQKEIAHNDQTICELGIKYTSKLRHEGQDPLLFLDMRSGRRFMKANSQGKTVLNLFSYTCGIGIAAAVGGAKKVMNVDFSSFALAAGRKNSELNQVQARCEFIQSDAFPVLRQLAGLKVSVRRGKKSPDYPKLEQQQFDLVFLDPPKFAKSAFGTVDLVNDYQSLFKPAMLATKEGGTIVACNNVAKVDRDSWYKSLVRCVEKQGREVVNTQWLEVDEDFPSFDNNHPLKIVALTLL